MKLVKNKNGVYLIRYKDAGGRTHQISTKQKDRTKAAAVARDSKIEALEMAATAGALTHQAVGVILSGGKINVSKALGQWEKWQRSLGRAESSLHTNLLTLGRWLRDMKIGDMLVSNLEEKHINPFVNPEKENIGKKARNARLSAIRSFCSFCTAKGWVSGDPSQLVRINNRLMNHRQKEGRDRRPFTKREFRKLTGFLDTFPSLSAEERGNVKMEWVHFWSRAVRFSYWTGLRLGDICNLEWESFTTKNEIVVWTDKKDSRVALPLSDPLIGSDELKEVIANLPFENGRYVFPSQRAINLDVSGRHGLSQNFSRWVKRADLPDNLTFHCLRHSFVSRLSREGKSLEEIGRFVAHKDTSTTEGYNHG